MMQETFKTSKHSAVSGQWSAECLPKIYLLPSESGVVCLRDEYFNLK
ncbi:MULTISPECIES: hypothetical protein [Moorena]|nr:MULTISPECIES: hypothetical protein [Moorena]NEP31960.1 hypothetical protein [Moorena sp. SIO3B2]NEQ09527.1 hypothetical protein [Moorena sp. SIO4E2]NEQ13774.1 hypothetical protein [Moorena sp. SIO3E2]NES45755.1 hypothetical protein [Moorena sp. SIO2C4]